MNFLSALREEFSSVWTLLNDTSYVLSRSKLFSEYEKELREWRAELQQYGQDSARVFAVRQKIKTLRTFLRQQGVELVLGRKDIQTCGWRHDDAMAEGFKRCIFLITSREVFWITGTLNHGELKESLAKKLGIEDLNIWPDVHSLWYRWHRHVLELAGADSEDQESWKKFCHFCDNNKNFIIKFLKNMT